METTKVGIIGCGNISGIYLHNIGHVFKNLELTACADINIEAAKAKANQKDENGRPTYPGLKAMTVDELLVDNDIQIVVNLTTPQAHFDVAMRVIKAGKSVYNEKPLTLSFEEGRTLIREAEKNAVRVGCAPDTFMGAGIQTARKLIEDGWIGAPTSATAFMCCAGHESWHPNPNFYYLKGGGPMFDMGPYYLTALLNLLGPVESVAGMTGMATKTRVCTSAENSGKILPVEVPTHVAGLLKFSTGAIGTIITSFDVAAHHLPNIEVHGTLGSIRVPDPNTFGGPVEYSLRGTSEWSQVPLTHSYSENSRGIGAADMARAITENREHRASGNLALHVLEIMHALHRSSDNQSFVKIESKAATPQPLKMGIIQGDIE